MRFAAALTAMLLSSGVLFAADLDVAPPGTLIDVGGHKVHLYCTGNGGPTVVLVAGASSFSIDWALVQPGLSNRACAFDRPGYAWSDTVGVTDDGNQVVRDLHEALTRTNQPRPYVLVGQSLGGFFVRLYYDIYPQDVAGMVLIDAAHEDGLFTLFHGKPAPITSLSEDDYLAANVPSLPVRAPEAKLEDAYRRLPENLQRIHLTLLTRFFENMRSARLQDIVAFQKASYATLAHLHKISTANLRPLGNLPLAVLSRGVNNGAMPQRLQADLARLSTNSTHLTVEQSDHEIHLYYPAVTIAWINNVVAAAQSGSPLAR
jgi:pimeloyl-ACP methyl ester carboxylesterase